MAHVNEPRLFDEYATKYSTTVQDVIGASGESVEYFARLKIDLMRDALAGESVETILDFGCGIGNTTRELATQFPTAAITGYDASSESIAVARGLTSEDGRTSFMEAEDDRLPFADESFDAAFTACVFHHIERAEHGSWARELLRVLRPGGTLFLFEHNPYNPLTRKVVRECAFDEGVILLEPGYARRMLGEAGFLAGSPKFYFFFPHVLKALRPGERALRRVPFGAQYYVVGRRP